jgi:hypothetical protein
MALKQKTLMLLLVRFIRLVRQGFTTGSGVVNLHTLDGQECSYYLHTNETGQSILGDLNVSKDGD